MYYSRIDCIFNITCVNKLHVRIVASRLRQRIKQKGLKAVPPAFTGFGSGNWGIFEMNLGTRCLIKNIDLGKKD